MTEETPETREQTPALSGEAAPTPAKRARPKPGRHGSGREPARPAPVVAATLAALVVPTFDVPDAPPAPKKPRPKGSLTAPRSSQAVPVHSLLSLEDTISVTTALAVRSVAIRGRVNPVEPPWRCNCWSKSPSRGVLGHLRSNTLGK